MQNKLLLLTLIPAFAAAAFAVAFLIFYPFFGGNYQPPTTPEVAFRQITPPAGVANGPPAANAPARPAAQRGLLAIDAQHDNAFTETEILTLTAQVAARGYAIEFIGDAGAAGLSYSSIFAPEPPPEALMDPPDPPEARLRRLADALRRADSLAVITPQQPYSAPETALIQQFVNQGGRLLLISDPSRPQRINTLAAKFGLDFQPDYLYDANQNDLNFRRILVRDFQPSRLTAGLETIVFPVAGSIQSAGPPVAFAAPGAQSSLSPNAAPLYPAAWGQNRNVLAISDITFMIPPNNSLMDNGRLIANLADYLTGAQREFHLTDFPHFYRQASGIDILIAQPSLLDAAMHLKNNLTAHNLPSRIVPAENPANDTIFLGLHPDALQVAPYLQAAGLRVDDTIGAPSTPELPLTRAALFLLSPGPNRHALTILADTPDTLAAAVDSLFSGDFRNGLSGDFIGIRQYFGALQ